MDYTVHRSLQARILEWVAFPSSRESCQPKDRMQVSCIAGRFFTSWAKECSNHSTIALNSRASRLCSTSFKLGFSNTWTENFQMFKLYLEKAKRPEIKLPSSSGSQKNQGNTEKTSTSSLTMLKPLNVWITTSCGKLLKRWEYQTTLFVSWEACMQDKKQQLEMNMEQCTVSKLGKKYVWVVYCHLAYLTSIMWVYHVKCQAGWLTNWDQDYREKFQQPQICRCYHSNGRKWRKTKQPLDIGERGELKAGLIFNIQKTKIVISGPVSSWWIDREKVESVTDLIFLGSKIIAEDDCSHEIKRSFLLGRKSLTNVDSILKSRGITLPAKVHIIKALVFPVVIHGCESWTLKKAEHQRTDTFKLWC